MQILEHKLQKNTFEFQNNFIPVCIQTMKFTHHLHYFVNFSFKPHPGGRIDSEELAVVAQDLVVDDDTADDAFKEMDVAGDGGVAVEEFETFHKVVLYMDTCYYTKRNRRCLL